MKYPLPVPQRVDPPACSTEEYLNKECKHVSVTPTSAVHTMKRSRVCITLSGDYSTTLIVLANAVYPGYNDRDHVAFWKDGDWKNETWDNIGVALLRSHGIRRKSSLGIPSGTAEYHRVYRERNKALIAESNRKASRKYQAKVRAAIKEERRAADAAAEAEPVDMIAEIMATAGMPGEPE